MDFKPWSYQEYAIKHIINNPAAGLFLDMGMGKTISTLTAIDNLLFLGDINKILVIAPLRVAEDTWSTEVDKWDHISHLRVSKILGTKKQRREALMKDADIYVTNRENIDWLVNECFSSWLWDMVVIDELSSFKSSKAKRFRALKKVRPYFKRIVGLTGTPAPNSLIDLWPQIYLLDGGKRLGKTITSYRQQYFNPGRRNQYVVYNWELKEGAEEQIHKKIGDICISMMAKDYLDIPARIDNVININLPKQSMDKYKQLEKDLVIELGEDDITATNAAVLTNKLLQMSNGAIYSEDKSVLEIHEEKLKALLDIIEAANGKPVLIFYSFKHDFDRIVNFLKTKKLNAIGLEDSKDIKKWNNGEIPILLVHPASAGHGLNLQYGGNIIVWFGLTWSLELYQQANARLHRQGQKESVIIHHLVSKDTVDEDVIKALDSKEVNQNVLLEAVKARLKESR
ncbi:SNF2-related protein [Clostridium botulinum]|uniref:SNF2 domain protein n=1 Tax=Clostridium botulinum (strain Langeland / NCTC 10281 / Type F) TaxID=441772 RepID=A7GFV7_CLOBL|nr:DEAD/DEAH box helicase [Clostridium botulinum]ABS40171.1 SNF2 domain protein [Clostridium botulinum F str. Langeland]ADG00077.1 SNF2 domain protein [Clostridium botulinum F str. 230613]KKM42372.1 DEAD/DEAH box helicase [Clostridium botulinum]MBY6793147.1 DEAD/DEAH box helicase [Clostridium botulinum]MBY6937357.1 DEAD/DEAH box helicase [Clostridium botulinum]